MELKPCRCGSGNWVVWEYRASGKETTYYVECRGCGLKTEGYTDEWKAIGAWNRRNDDG